MKITRDVWLELTKDDRLVCLLVFASQNAQRWQKRWQNEKQLPAV